MIPELDHIPLSINQILVEVPGRAFVRFALQKLVQRMGLFSDDFGLGKHWEVDLVVLPNKAQYGTVAFGFLVAKLVAGEAENDKMFGWESVLEFYELFVVNVSEATLAGYVNDQNNLKIKVKGIRISFAWIHTVPLSHHYCARCVPEVI